MSNTLTKARPHDLGHGLIVQRSLPSTARRMIGPFVFFDHAGPVKMDAKSARLADVRPHPHIGLSTVSYLLSGAVTHRDSLGSEQLILPGEVNWMTAGRGIVHSERFDDPDAFAGNGLELLQSWVALPEADEETEPSFTNYPVQVLPETQHDGVWMRVIAGTAFDLRSPVKTHSPLFYLHTVLKTGAKLGVPTQYSERAAYVVNGRILIESDGQEITRGQTLVFGQDSEPALHAIEPSTVMLLGGEPLGTRHIWWNFVSSRKQRIRQAADDWKAGRLKLPPNDNQEFIPLPEEPATPPPKPLS
ncbi:MAG: pirin family protein [Gammaproteobacteria bacterium]